MPNGVNYTTKEMFEIFERKLDDIRNDVKSIKHNYEDDHDCVVGIDERSSYNRKLIIGALLAFILQIGVQLYFNLIK